MVVLTEDSRLDDRHVMARRLVFPCDSDCGMPDLATGTTMGVHDSEDPLVPCFRSTRNYDEDSTLVCFGV